MTDAVTIAGLIERVEKATGPDRTLDAMIAAAFRIHWTPPEHWINRSPEVEFRPMPDVGWRAGWLEIWMPGEQASRDRWKAAQYTASLDAVTALAERLMPGAKIGIDPRFYIEDVEPNHVKFDAILCIPHWDRWNPVNGDWIERHEARHRDQCCASILALLRSIEAKTP